jgi:hypothetical protein
MLPTKIRQLLASKEIEHLAVEYVAMTTGPKRGGKLYAAQDVLDEIARRVDPVQLQIEIHNAREVLQMMGLDDVQMKRR